VTGSRAKRPGKGYRMAYTVTNYKTAKAVKDAVKNGERVEVYQPNAMFGPLKDGETSIEGPHFPAGHAWWLRVVVRDGAIERIVK